MFRVKICGVTTTKDAEMAAAAGADAIGLNFYPKSPRYVSSQRAREIVQAVGSSVQFVGVFVNESADCIHQTCGEVGLCWVQLHGDESPRMVGEMANSIRVIRVCRLADANVRAIADDLAACKAAGRLPAALLLDAVQPGAYGGTGHQLDWEQLADARSQLGETPLVLAGGLNPVNLATAIRTVRPQAVDVASGVESEPGRKDAELVRRFVRAALAEFGE